MPPSFKKSMQKSGHKRFFSVHRVPTEVPTKCRTVCTVTEPQRVASSLKTSTGIPRTKAKCGPFCLMRSATTLQSSFTEASFIGGRIIPL
ncbi:hypothetical protein CEXT_749581 [Caerostris extrusa]|uniref:Uncharacterized protein n=1 Tax=Caerostris extrusa TaxID=172846 RepID=A0AAV4T410_CAEEX|nr:hypothetical protein CEXT_749581 [Caerostris extrusa]